MYLFIRLGSNIAMSYIISVLKEVVINLNTHNLKNVDNMNVLNESSRKKNINYEMHLPGVQQNQIKR